MNWLFIHQNFPGQYVHIASRLAAAGDRVVSIGQQHSASLAGVERIEYAPAPPSSAPEHYVHEFELAVQNGAAVARACRRLKSEGFVPDLVIGHSGWGETLYAKDVWPRVPLLGYFEFFYHAVGSDIGFDPEFPPDPDIALRLRTRNAIGLSALDAADWGQTPTNWQRDQYPATYRDRIGVLHEGIDTDFVHPDPNARLWLRGGDAFGSEQEIITYSARNLEPYRGFHIFMRALPRVLRNRPNARVLIVGGDAVSYGVGPSGAASWRERLLDELGGKLDLERIHFLGHLGFRQYLAVLQISSVHAYLTYPFVLSWSLLEAMSAGCLVVASRTPPVEEVVRDGENGYLVDFFDTDRWAGRLCEVLENPPAHRHLRQAARDSVVGRYDLRSVCLPAYLELIELMTGRQTHARPARAASASPPRLLRSEGAAARAEAKSRLELARTRLRENDAAGAEAAALGVLALDPRSDAAELVLARASLRRRDPAGAEAAARRVLARDGGRSEAHALLAAARLHRGDAEGAEAAALQALAANPQLDEAELALARARLRRNDPAGAEAAALRVLARRPRSLLAAILAARAAERQGDAAKAAAHYRRLAELAPDDERWARRLAESEARSPSSP